MSGDKQTDRRRVLLFVLLVVAIAAIPGRMAWSMRSDSQAKASATRDEVRDLGDRIAQARRDQARTGELNDQLQALAAAMPPDADLSSVVEQLAALAREANVTWKTSSQNQPVATRETRTATEDESAPTTAPASEGTTATTAPASLTGTFLVDLDLEGTTANLTTFLEKLRSLPRVLTVERMTWSWQDGATGGSNTQVVAAHLTVKAYTWSGAPRSPASSTGTVATAGAGQSP